ncbi:MAG: hypothetical protein K8R49_07520 [Candidatus Cloacimonetes bacterium]|nr:hypothetical protein [Candidatus Cloacimonadota bacterium]
MKLKKLTILCINLIIFFGFYSCNTDENTNSKTKKQEFQLNDVNSVQKTWQVSNIKELINIIKDSLGNNDIILIDSGTYEFEKAILFKGIENITVKGKGVVQLICTNMYDEILHFDSCNIVKIENISARHNELDECMGAVIKFSACDSIYITGCELNGCGREGIFARDCKYLYASKNYIHHNSCCGIDFNRIEINEEIFNIPGLVMESNKMEYNGEDSDKYPPAQGNEIDSSANVRILTGEWSASLNGDYRSFFDEKLIFICKDGYYVTSGTAKAELKTYEGDDIPDGSYVATEYTINPENITSEFLISGLAHLYPDSLTKLKTAFAGNQIMNNDSILQFKINNTSYVIFCKSSGNTNYHLILRNQKTGKKQQFFQLNNIYRNDFLIIRWIGDLDKDNKPDIIFNGIPNNGYDSENVYNLQLYLSSAAKGDLIIQKVDEFTQYPIYD